MISDKPGEERSPWGRGPCLPSFAHSSASRAFHPGDLLRSSIVHALLTSV